ncbi:MAG: DMT family transporter [Flammeovirgaceae bacterium]|nr:DMT family transporter [Flammeovirgaceae bacterium]
MSLTRSYLRLHFIVFLWGFTAILGLLISIPAVEMVFLRTLLAAGGLGILLLVTHRPFKLATTDYLPVILTGFIISAHWITFFESARLSNASVSLVGFATNSLWAALLEPWIKKRKIKWFEVALGFMVIIGLYIIFSFDFQYKAGLLLGVISGLLIAIFSVLNSGFVQRIDPFTITFYEMIGATLCTALFFPVYLNLWAIQGELNFDATSMDWMYIAILAIVCTVYAYSVAVDLLKQLSVFILQLTFNLEPLYGIGMAVLILGESEKMHFNFYIGTLVILSAVLSYPLLKRKFEPQSFPAQ